jgi:hypothetical protein
MTIDLDLEKLKLTQDYEALAGVKKVITTIPVARPHRHLWIRVHPEWQLEAAIFEDKTDRATYLIDPSCLSLLIGEVVGKVLYVYMDRQSRDLRIWPIRLPGEDGKLDNWSKSALAAAQIAKNKWIRLASNQSLGAYDVFESKTSADDVPIWPEITFKEVLEIAFTDYYINTSEHPVIKRLEIDR